MMQSRTLWPLSSCWLLLCCLSVGAQATSQFTGVFDYPVQSHASNGKLKMDQQSSIESGSVGTIYPFPVKDIKAQARCNGGGGYDNTGTWVSACDVNGTQGKKITGLTFISDPRDFPVDPNDFPFEKGKISLSCDGAISPEPGLYQDVNWSSPGCVATLRAGGSYYFESMVLSGGAVLRLNGATLYAETLRIDGSSEGVTGSGDLHAQTLTVTGNGKLAGARVTAYKALNLSTNGVSNVSANFQPHYLDSVALNAQSQMRMASGNWSIKTLTLQGNSTMQVQGKGNLQVYDLDMTSQQQTSGQISTTGLRSDLLVKLYQTLKMSLNANINGYLQAHYLKTFERSSASHVDFYFGGGSHWIKSWVPGGQNDNFIFDSGTPAQLYVDGSINLTQQVRINAAGKANNLMLYGFGVINMHGNARLNAILYVHDSDLNMSGDTILTGAVASNHLTMTDRSKVIHEPFSEPPVPPLPYCSDIFTNPPKEGLLIPPPPGRLLPPLYDLSCDGSGCTSNGSHISSFAPGDHDFNHGNVGHDGKLVTPGVTARLYFNSMSINNGALNTDHPAENLFTYVNGDLSIAGHTKINGIIYVTGNVKVAGNASIDGALAAGGNIDIKGNGDFEFSQEVVDKADLSGFCQKGNNGGGAQVDHFELHHSGQALTCNPETVTIKACVNSDCSQLMTGQVSATLSLSPSSGSNGWIGGNQLSFSGGTTMAQLRNNTAGAVTIGVSSSTPAFFHETLCRAGSGAPSTAACTLTFADSGFLFDVLDTLANKPQQVQLKAVKKDNATQKCVPGFASVSKPVSFWSDYVSPATNGFGSKMTVNGNAVATSQGASPQTLAFDAQGEATLTVSYPDAGQMRLNASHDGSGDTAGLVMTGADPFVSRPAGLCITPVQGACAAGDVSCPVFKKTGDDFQLNIGAVAWQADNDTDLCSGNLATPNFALTNIALGSQLVAPKPGVEAMVGKASYDHVITTGSNLNAVTQSVNEVGVFRMTAIPPASGYFGYSLPAVISVPVGRFVPWDFHLMSGTVTPACGGFSYMSQPFGVLMTVQARNQQQGITRNYRDAFAKGVISLVAANNKDGVDRSNRLDPLVAGWSAGETSVNGQNRFVRLRELTPALTAPEEPLRLLRLGLQVMDGEATATTTTFLTGRDMNPGVKGDCQVGVNCTARQLSIPGGSGDTMIAYYGRLLASTRQGVDGAPLALPLQVQYFEAGQWRVNQQDVCTQLSLAGGAIAFTDPGQHYDAGTGDLILQGGTKIRLGLGQVAPGGSQTRVEAGETGFHFAPPNQAVRIPYRILLERQPSAPLWLTDPAMPGHLLGEAIFGSSRGNDRIIYRRELMPQN